MLSQFSIECQPASFFLKPYSKVTLKFDAHTNGNRTALHNTMAYIIRSLIK